MVKFPLALCAINMIFTSIKGLQKKKNKQNKKLGVRQITRKVE